MSTQENKAIVRRLFEESDRRQQFAVEFLGPGFIGHIPGAPDLNLETFLKFVNPFYTGFSNWSRTFEDLIAEGDRVAFRVTSRMTQSGEFMGVPASGKLITFSTIGMAKLANGKIVEWWNSPDRLGMMQQVGAIKL